MQVKIFRTILSEEPHIAEGDTLQGIFEAEHLDPALMDVFIQGSLTPDWSTVDIDAGADISVYPHVQGTASQWEGGLSILGGILSSAASVFGWCPVGWILGGLALISFTAAGIIALCNSPGVTGSSKTSESAGSPTQDPSISGSGNSLSPDSAWPVILGKRFITPYLCSPYNTRVYNTEYDYNTDTFAVSSTAYGKLQYMFSEMAVGYAPLEIEDMKIGGMSLGISTGTGSDINKSFTLTQKEVAWLSSSDEITIDVQQTGDDHSTTGILNTVVSEESLNYDVLWPYVISGASSGSSIDFHVRDVSVGFAYVFLEYSEDEEVSWSQYTTLPYFASGVDISMPIGAAYDAVRVVVCSTPVKSDSVTMYYQEIPVADTAVPLRYTAVAYPQTLDWFIAPDATGRMVIHQGTTDKTSEFTFSITSAVQCTAVVTASGEYHTTSWSGASENSAYYVVTATDGTHTFSRKIWAVRINRVSVTASNYLPVVTGVTDSDYEASLSVRLSSAGVQAVGASIQVNGMGQYRKKSDGTYAWSSLPNVTYKLIWREIGESVWHDFTKVIDSTYNMGPYVTVSGKDTEHMHRFELYGTYSPAYTWDTTAKAYTTTPVTSSYLLHHAIEFAVRRSRPNLVNEMSPGYTAEEGATYYDTCTWINAKTYCRQAPLTADAANKLCRIAVRAKASDVMKSSFGKISVTVSSILPVYDETTDSWKGLPNVNGSGTITGKPSVSTYADWQVTSNPADLLLSCFAGIHCPKSPSVNLYQNQIDDKRFDWSELKDLWRWCNEPRTITVTDSDGTSSSYALAHQCQANLLITSQSTVQDIISQILTPARAALTMTGGRFRIVHDVTYRDAETGAVLYTDDSSYKDPTHLIDKKGFLTPRNSSDLSIIKTFVRVPDAVKITFPDEENDNQTATLEVKNPLLTSAEITAKKAAGTFYSTTLTSGAITNAYIAAMYARYCFNTSVVRDTALTAKVGLQHLMLPLGTRIQVQSDVIVVGIGSGRIRVYAHAPGADWRVTSDETFRWVTAKTVGMTVWGMLSGAEASYTFPAVPSDAIDDPSEQGYSIGKSFVLTGSASLDSSIFHDCYCIFGYSGIETAPYMLMNKVVDTDNAGTLQLVKWDPSCFAVSTSAYPEHRSFKTVISRSASSDISSITSIAASAKDAANIQGQIDANLLFTGNLVPQGVNVPASADGTVSDYTAAAGVFHVLYSGTDVTGNGPVYSVVAQEGCTGTIDSATGAYTVSALSADTGILTLRATYQTKTIEAGFTVTKAYSGADGATAVVYSVEATAMAVAKSISNVFTPATVTFNFFKTTGSVRAANSNYYKIYGSTDGSIWNVITSGTTAATSATLTPSTAYAQYKCEQYLSYSGGVLSDLKDTEYTTVISDGATGTAGVSPVNIVCGNENQSIACTSGGLVSAADTITIPFAGYTGTSRAACTVAYSTLPSGVTLTSNTAATTSADGALILAVAANATLGGSSILKGTITLTFTCSSLTFTKTFTWTKALAGLDGTNVTAVTITDPSSTVPLSGMTYNHTYYGIYNGLIYRWDWTSTTAGAWTQASAEYPTNIAVRYSFDEMPEQPDDSGALYKVEYGKFSSTDYWSAYNGAISLVNGAVINTVTATGHNTIFNRGVSIASKIFRVQIRLSADATLGGIIYYNSTTALKVIPALQAGVLYTLCATVPADATDTRLILNLNGSSAGSTVSVLSLYLGDGTTVQPIIDNISGACNGTGTSVLSYPGAVGRACYFPSSVSQFVRAGSITFGPSLSISLWGMFNNTADTMTLFQNRTALGYGVSLFLLGGKVRFDYDAVQTTFDYSLSAGTLYHICVTSNGTQKRLYINGALQQTVSYTAASNSYFTPYMWIGGSSVDGTTTTGNLINGYLDDLCIATAVWTDQQVLGLYLDRGAHAKLYTLSDYKIDSSVTSYSIVSNNSSFTRSRTGAVTPPSFIASAKAVIDDTTVAYAGRFIIYITQDGSTWTSVYTSSANESSAHAYVFTTGPSGVRVELYRAGGTTSLVATRDFSIPYDSSVAPQYLGIGILTSTSTKTFTGAVVDTNGVITPGSTVSTSIPGDWMVNYSGSVTTGIYYWSGSAWVLTSDSDYVNAAVQDLYSLNTGGVVLAAYTAYATLLVKNLFANKIKIVSLNGVAGAIYGGSRYASDGSLADNSKNGFYLAESGKAYLNIQSDANGNLIEGTGAGLLLYSGAVEGSYNLFLGTDAGGAATGSLVRGASYNTGVGYSTLYTALGYGYNTAIGVFASHAVYGQANVCIGSYAGYTCSTDESVNIGSYAGYSNYGAQTINIGQQAGRTISSSAAVTNSISIGTQAGFTVNASNQIAIGPLALYTGPSGSSCIGIGAQALKAHGGTGYSEIGIGSYALRSYNSTGRDNIGIGTRSLDIFNNTGDANIGLGDYSLGNFNGPGSHNIGIGSSTDVASTRSYQVNLNNRELHLEFSDLAVQSTVYDALDQYLSSTTGDSTGAIGVVGNSTGFNLLVRTGNGVMVCRQGTAAAGIDALAIAASFSGTLGKTLKIWLIDGRQTTPTNT